MFGAHFANLYRREATRQARTAATRNASSNTSRTTATTSKTNQQKQQKSVAVPSVAAVTENQLRSDPYSLTVSFDFAIRRLLNGHGLFASASVRLSNNKYCTYNSHFFVVDNLSYICL